MTFSSTQLDDKYYDFISFQNYISLMGYDKTKVFRWFKNSKMIQNFGASLQIEFIPTSLVQILQSNYNWSEEIVHVAQTPLLDEEDKRDATLPRLSGWLLMEAAEAVSLASTSSFHTCVKWTN